MRDFQKPRIKSLDLFKFKSIPKSYLLKETLEA